MDTVRILLDHNHIEEFYEMVKNPDEDQLMRRDRFLQELAQNRAYTMDGNDLVASIPDVDIDALLSKHEAMEYIPVARVSKINNISLSQKEIAKGAKQQIAYIKSTLSSKVYHRLCDIGECINESETQTVAA